MIDDSCGARLGVNHVRYDQGEGNMEVVTDASWHLSFWGGEQRILDKIEAYAHQENNIQEYKVRLRARGLVCGVVLARACV